MSASRYKVEIEKAIVEVERLNDARGVQMNRVKLVEREKSALEVRRVFPAIRGRAELTKSECRDGRRRRMRS